MSTVTATSPTAARRRVPLSVRGAQLMFLVPLGTFQLAASTYFLTTLGVDGPLDVLVGAWAVAMSAAGAVTGLVLGRGRLRTLRVALGLLAAQTAFGTIKLTVYGESASFVFFGFVVVAAALLALPASRRHFRSRVGTAAGR